MAGKQPVKTIWTFLESYSTLRGAPGSRKIKKLGPFLGETCSWGLFAPTCHRITFIELANIVLAYRRSIKTICTVSGSDMTHMDVTRPLKFE